MVSLKKAKELHLGLDLGTNSIGWALLNENNELITKKRGKHNYTFWGVRLFEEGDSSRERRLNRNQRRRLRRRRKRIELLQDIFKDEINKVDGDFFDRLNTSFFKFEDKIINEKKIGKKHTLFADDKYTDKDFFKKYPTIFHLRKALIDNKNPDEFDIRHYYLALHNIIKFRGNFLNPNLDVNNIGLIDYEKIKSLFNDFNQLIHDNEDLLDSYELIDTDVISDDNIKELIKILNEKIGLKEKSKKIEAEIFKSIPKNHLFYKLIINLLLGRKVGVKDLGAQNDSKDSISLNDSNYEQNLQDLIANNSDIENILSFISRIKEIYELIFIQKILKDHEYISEYMIELYNNEIDDSNNLRDILKKYSYDDFLEIFVNNKNNKDSQKKNIDSFYSEIKKILEKINGNTNISLDIKDKDIIEDILNKIENKIFLLKQRNGGNGSIPKQLHEKELIKILDNCSKKYSFLKEQDSKYNISNIDKIIKIFNFKIPYYVGPLYFSNNGKYDNAYSWAIRNTNEKILPWNFDKVININKTATKFITRAQKKCTYLRGNEDYCLPKNSILYKEYTCWEYINKLKINGSLIGIKEKKELFNDVFKKEKSPTKKRIINYITSKYNIDENNFAIEECNCSMNSYINFVDIFGKEFVDDNIEKIEEIIKSITIFEDKKILEDTITREFPEIQKDKIGSIKGLNYKDYGRFCKNLLNGIQNSSGETIIDLLRETNYNLQQIMYQDKEERNKGNLDRLNFEKIVNDYNKKIIDNSNNKLSPYEYISNNLIASPIVKRTVNQAYKIITEIEKITKRKIDKYYVECTRTNKAKKEVTNSRYNQISSLYKECEDLAKLINQKNEISDLKNELENYKDRLKSDKLYLYFTQLGRCIYSNEKIDINNLMGENSNYDIDHIYPQSLIKDDSILNNKVLTTKTINEKIKGEHFTFECQNLFTNGAPELIEYLRKKELIAVEKYNRLTKKSLSDAELSGFLNRQINATDQSVINLVNLLVNYHEGKNETLVKKEDIIFSKAENISEFRNNYGFIKSREANNFHHAHDAYLNVVVGKALSEYYKLNHIYEKNFDEIRNSKNTINPKKILETNRNFNGKKIWDKDTEIGNSKDGIVDRNSKIFKDLYSMNTLSINVTKMLKEENGLLSKVTIKSNGKYPVKNYLPSSKYGGLTDPKYNYFLLNKTKKGFALEPYAKILKTAPIGKKVLINSILYNKKENVSIIITGVQSGGKRFRCCNFKERYFDYDKLITIKKIYKIGEKIKFKEKLGAYFENQTVENDTEKKEQFIEVYYSSNKNNYVFSRLYMHEIIDIIDYCLHDLFERDCYKNLLFSSEDNKETLNVLKQYKEKNFSFENLLYLSKNLLGLLMCNQSNSANLLLIGGKENAFTISQGRNLNSDDAIYTESVTGYYKTNLTEKYLNEKDKL